MKKMIITLSVLFSFTLQSQNSKHKVGISAGGGFQNYKGDLGSSFRFGNVSSYGSTVFSASFYWNPSLDAGIFASVGDYGYCQPQTVANAEVSAEYRCLGCNRVGLGNLSSRMYSGGMMVKYKFANGYLLKEDASIRPYVYAGAGVNHLSDIMKMNCVSVGNYLSANAGIGMRYYVNERMNIGYQIALGYFLSDNIDFMNHGRGNDMYLQNSITLGFDL